MRPGTSLGEGVRIGNFVESKAATLEAGAKVNHISYVGDAHVGANSSLVASVKIGKGATSAQAPASPAVQAGAAKDVEATLERAEKLFRTLNALVPISAVRV